MYSITGWFLSHQYNSLKPENLIDLGQLDHTSESVLENFTFILPPVNNTHRANYGRSLNDKISPAERKEA